MWIYSEQECIVPFTRQRGRRSCAGKRTAAAAFTPIRLRTRSKTQPLLTVAGKKRKLVDEDEDNQEGKLLMSAQIRNAVQVGLELWEELAPLPRDYFLPLPGPARASAVALELQY